MKDPSPLKGVSLITILNKQQKFVLNKIIYLAETRPFSIESLFELIESILTVAQSSCVDPLAVINDFRTKRDLRMENDALKKQVKILEDMVESLSMRQDIYESNLGDNV